MPGRVQSSLVRRGGGRKREGKVPKGQVAKMSGLYGESLWAEEGSIEGGVYQPYPVTGGNSGMLGEPGGLVYLNMLNRHLSHCPG